MIVIERLTTMCFNRIEMISREFGKITCAPINKVSSDTAIPSDWIQYNSDVELFGASGAYGSFVHREVQVENYSLWHSNYSLRKDLTLAIISQQPALSLNFVLKSSINFQLDGFSNDNMQEQQYNLIYTPRTRCEYVFRENEEYTFFGIQYTTEYLDRWKSQFHFLTDFLKKAENGVPVMMSSNHPTATPEMRAIIWEVLQEMYTTPIRKIRLELKSLELLEASLEHISKYKLGAEHLKLSEEDTKRMREVREYLLQHLNEDITLKSLAREVGTNLLKLKTGFKQLYGVSVFQFLREERMKKARKLLLETYMPVYKISSAVGYPNPANFATSFKKKFGYPPSKLRG